MEQKETEKIRYCLIFTYKFIIAIELLLAMVSQFAQKNSKLKDKS